MIKTHQVYTTSDGTTFEAGDDDPQGRKAYSAASAHEQALTRAKVAQFDPTPEVDGFTRRFEVLMQGSARQREKFPERKFGYEHTFPMLLLVEDKHSTCHFLINTRTDLEDVGFTLLTERVNANYWYENEDAKIAQAIVDANAKGAAFAFLTERDGQYEKVTLESFDKL